jgi:hypothetical protein
MLLQGGLTFNRPCFFLDIFCCSALPLPGEFFPEGPFTDKCFWVLLFSKAVIRIMNCMLQMLNIFEQREEYWSNT